MPHSNKQKYSCINNNTKNPQNNINNNQKTVTSQVTNNFNFGGVTTHRESDVDHLARELNSLIKRDQKLVGE